MITEKLSWILHEGLQIFSIDIQPGGLRFATRGGDQKCGCQFFYLASGSDDQVILIHERKAGSGTSKFGSGEPPDVENCKVILTLRGHTADAVLGFRLGSHFSNFKLNEFCAFKSWLLSPLMAPVNTLQIYWYIMTSPFTDEATRKFFESHRYFGLEPDQVTFFQQGTLPCVSADGRFIMETPYKVAKAPDGNGGVYAALKSKMLLDDMAARGVKYIDCYGVDNVLVCVADPTFLGYFIDRGVCCCKGCKEGISTRESWSICSAW